MSLNIPSEHDLELLSAYLDGELSDRDRQHVEQRLSEDAALRSALNDLRDTVALLQSLPRLKAPHDFTLDPAHYRSPAINFYRLLQFSGALGTLAAMLLIAFAVFLDQGAVTTSDSASHEKAPSSPAVAIVPSITPLAETDQALTFDAGTESEGEILAPMPAPTVTVPPMPPTSTFYATAQPQFAEPAVSAAQAEEMTQNQPPAAVGGADQSSEVYASDQPLEASGAAAYDAVAFPTTTMILMGTSTSTGTSTAAHTSTPPPTPTLARTFTPAMEREADDEQPQPSMKATAILAMPSDESPESPASPVTPASPPVASSEEETSLVWLAQLGFLLLLVSISAFMWGYWKARH